MGENNDICSNKIKAFFNIFSTQKRIKLISAANQIGTYELIDAARMLETLVPILGDELIKSVKRLDSISEIHSFLTKENQKIEQPNLPIQYTDVEESFLKECNIDLEGTGLSMTFPRETHDLINWGLELHHCIASYTKEALAKSFLFPAIYVDGSLTYTIQMSPLPRFDIHQFYGNFDCPPDPNHDTRIRKTIRRSINRVINNAAKEASLV